VSAQFLVVVGAQGFQLRLQKDDREEYVGSYVTLGSAMMAARAIDKRVPIKVDPRLLS